MWIYESNKHAVVVVVVIPGLYFLFATYLLLSQTGRYDLQHPALCCSHSLTTLARALVHFLSTVRMFPGY